MLNTGKILIVDDEANARRVLRAILTDQGYSVIESADVDRAVELLHEESVLAVITDMKMPRKSGYDLFEFVNQNHPGLPVLFLTAYGTVESAVEAMANGAFHYFIKPPDYTKLSAVLANAIRQHAERQVPASTDEAPDAFGLHEFATRTPAASGILTTVEMVKDSETSVLLQGETGTGKELLACSLHRRSIRRDKPFIAVNCAAIPRDLIEAELFGSEKGAYTGAVSTRRGKFEEAEDGTLFLDEIGELELSLQSKLLRVLQERTIERLGSNTPIRVNFRLVSSTNRDLSREVAEGRFREDLYYRINVIQIRVPPLRERHPDIPCFVGNFVREFCKREKKQVAVSDEAMDILLAYSWPGNVRQLRNVIERAVVLTQGHWITAAELPAEIRGPSGMPFSDDGIRPLMEIERSAIKQALQECHGNKSQAARKLRISRKVLYSRLKQA